MKNKQTVKPSTQQYLDIMEIKDDVVILKDGTLRAVILVSSLNFSLKSEDEQNAIISSYISFLNSLDFPLQIVIQSRELDVGKYLDKLGEIQKQQENELLRMQTSEYIEYIRELVQMGKIMTRFFYVTVPYDPVKKKKKGLIDKAGAIFSPAKIVKLKRQKFYEYKDELVKRVNGTVAGLNGVGLSAVQINTQGLIELYYNIYNPKTSEMEKLGKVEELQIEQ